MEATIAPNNNTEDEAPVIFLDGVDDSNVKQEIWSTINKLFSYVTHLVNFKHHLILYRLFKKGYVSAEKLAEVSGYSTKRLYFIINSFEKREKEREAEG